MWPDVAISRHLGDFPRPFGTFFLEIYLLLGAFWAKSLFTGGDFLLELIYCWAIFCWQLGSFSLKLSGHTDSFQTNLFFLLCSTKPQSFKTFSLESTLCCSLSILICRLKSFDTSEQIKKIQFQHFFLFRMLGIAWNLRKADEVVILLELFRHLKLVIYRLPSNSEQ